jgi:hypothetical protein
VKGLYIDGLNVYCSVNDGPWQKRAFDSNAPYDDYTPPSTPGTPEKRRYRLRGVVSEVEVGLYSNIVEATVSE